MAINEAFHSLRFGVRPETPIHVEAIGVRVEFDPGVRFGAGVDDGALVDLVTLAFEEEPAGDMTERVNVGMFGSANEAARHFGFVGGEPLMEAGDHYIQLGE